MCQIDQREGTASFTAIRRVLRELFAKNHGGVHPTPPTSARVKKPEYLYARKVLFMQRYAILIGIGSIIYKLFNL